MNQILVTEKLYVTPELKRKKRMYKIHFLLSVLLIIIFSILAIYMEYDRGKSETESQEILGEFNAEIEDALIAKNKALIVVLDDAEQTEQIAEETRIQETQEKANKLISKSIKQTKDGYSYKIIANINIPKINVNYAVTDGLTHSIAETDALLKESPTKFWGADPNKSGNFSIVGHNYRNGKFFSKVPMLEKGDIIEITDNTNKTIQYSVYDKYQVVPENVDCLLPPTDGSTQITLITCTDDGKQRVIIKAKAI